MLMVKFCGLENGCHSFTGRHGTVFYIILSVLLMVGCKDDAADRPERNPSFPVVEDPDVGTGQGNNNPILPEIDLSNWKVTLPIPRASDGKPIEVNPPDILDYATNSTLLPFMYNDSTDGALVFYTYPGSSTANSSYSRTELREQMVPGSNNTNWTFSEGGRLRGTLAVTEMSTANNGDPHRTIIMQIHGRLTDAQRDLIGEDDNNAPPVLKIYWTDGEVRVKTKVLKNINASTTEMLSTAAWTDDEGRNFATKVGQDRFTLEVVVTQGRMEVTMNDDETFVYDDIHMQKWGVFENYFKAGNYLTTTDEGAFSKVKYYELEVSHDE
jgi:hypothetical protein